MAVSMIDEQAPRKVLCVHPGFELYGADRVFAMSIAAIAKYFSGWEIEIVLPQDGSIRAILPREGISIQYRSKWILRRKTMWRSLTSGLFRSLSCLHRAHRQMRSADIVYISTIIMLDYILMSRFLGKLVIVHVHEMPNGIELAVFRWLLIFSRAKLVFNSEATRKLFAMPADEGNRTLYNGAFDPGAPQQRVAAGREKLKLLMIGRLNHWKGQEILINAIGRLSAADRDLIDVRIVGSSFDNQVDFEHRIENLIDGLRLNDTIRLCPFEADPSESYRRSDVVVVPSRLPEPFGCVAIEAMAFGKAVVASRHGGLVEIVVDGETGRLFTPSDVSALAKILEELVANRQLIAEYGEAGRHRYGELFTDRAYSDGFSDILDCFVPARSDS